MGLKTFFTVTVDSLCYYIRQMTGHSYARPVIPLLLSMISGIALGSWIPGHKICAGLFMVLFLFFIIRTGAVRKTAAVSPLLLFAALGYLSIQPWASPDFPPHHVVHFLDTNPWKVTGILDAPPVKLPDRQKCILRVETLSAKNSSHPVIGKIRVTISGKHHDLFRGDRVVFSSRIKSIRNFNNPGGFDYKRYMAFKGVWGAAYVSEKNLTVRRRNPDKGIAEIIDNARTRISDFIETSIAGKEQGVLKTLIVGDKNAIPPDLREAFNRAGIGHLLAISGLHIGIVATAAFILFRWLLSRVDFFLWHAWVQKGAVVLSVIPVILYGVLSGMSPSTQRAVIMVALFLAAFLFEREQDLINTLGLAAMLVLIFHPPSLFSISFQLSFAAVLAILYGLSRIKISWIIHWEKKKKQGRGQLLKKLFYFFLASLLAILGTLPLVMLYFNQISLVGILTNFVLVPLVGFLVVPLGLLSVFFYLLSGTLAVVCLKAAAVVLTQALMVVNVFAGLPFAAVKTVTPTHFEIFCYYILFGAVLNLKATATKENEDHHETRLDGCGSHHSGPTEQEMLRRPTPAVVAAVVAFLFLGADAAYWFHVRILHDDLRVTVIDVGQGASALLELPGGRCALIDGGGFSDNRTFDVGARIVAPFLWRKKIKTVDTVILTHPNTDHLNGLLYIVRHFHVKRIWTNNEVANTRSYSVFIKAIEKMKIRSPQYDKLRKTHNLNGLLLKILYPPKDFMTRRKNEPWRNVNNNSLVVKVEFGSISFLFPGDIKLQAEKELVATAGEELRSTVLISPHHGSKTSSSAFFLDKVQPGYVVISSGWNNRFGFPHSQVLERYKERNCRVFRTDRHGAVAMSTHGETLDITSCL
ncbi:MAG: ComEC/Rec2 family competence protein [Deltaproteobacteria bacterium]|nr:ComEC/Rec2 family competence protein [Deltaproteobacteria bacterium]